MKDRVSIKRFLAFLLCAAMLVMYMPSPRMAFADVTSGDGAPVAEEPAQTPEPEPAQAPAVEPQEDPAPAPADAEPSGGSDGGEDLDAEVPAEGEEKPSGEVSGDVEGEEAEEQGNALDGEAVDGEIVDGEVVEDPEEEEYPAFKESKTVDGVTITLEAKEGVLPKGASFKAHRVNRNDVFVAVDERLEAEGKELVDAVAFDVTPVDKDGNEIHQPKGSVKVTFSGTGLDGNNVDVFHVSDDAGSVTEMGTSVANTNEQSFSTNHFSIYVASASTYAEPARSSGNGTQSNPYVLEYGDSITIPSNHGRLSSYWGILSGSGADLDGHTVTNVNRGSDTTNVIIRHWYRDYAYQVFSLTEDFYFECKPQELEIKFMLQDVGAPGFAEVGSGKAARGGRVTPPKYSDPSETDPSYRFYGWYLDEKCSKSADDALNSVTGKVTEVYARYTPEATIKYYKNTNEAATIPDNITAGVGNAVTLGYAEQRGFAFTGWKDADGKDYTGGKTIDMPSGGLELYAQWSDGPENKIKIYYHENSPRPTESDRVIRTELDVRKNWQEVLWDVTPEVKPLGDIHFVFRGWATNPNARNPQYYPETTFQTGEEDIDLYAVWSTLSFNNLKTLTAENATYVYDGKEHSITEVSGGMKTRIYNNEKYVMVGEAMFSGQDVYAKVENIKASGKNAGHYSTPITAPLYYELLVTKALVRLDIAPYIEINGGKLTITPCEVTIDTISAEKAYDGNELTAGGTAKYYSDPNSDNPTEVTKKEVTNAGGTIELIDGKTLNIKTTGTQTEVGSSDNGFEVDWGKPDDWGSTASTAQKFNFDIKPGNIGTLTVYYDVVFDKNTSDDVTGMPTEGAKAYKNVETGAITAAIPDNNPSREHYDFLGWSIDASATEAPYRPGDSVDVTEDMIRDNIVTLYAVWKIKQHTVTFDSQGGSNVPEQTVDDGSKASKPADPTRSGYTFDGWQLNGQPYDFSTPVTESIKLTAKWNSQPVTPTPAGTTDDDDNDGGNGGRGAAAAAAAAPAAPADGAADIADEPTPTTEPPATTIDDEPTPTSLTWAVGNLVMAIMTALGAVIALFRKKEDEDDEDDSADKKMLAAKIAGALAGVAAPITFFLTENMADVAVAFDKWTPLMAGILAVQVVSAVLNKTASKAADAAEEAAE